MKIFNGIEASNFKKQELYKITQKNKLDLKILFIQVNTLESSTRYIKLKMKMANELGIEATLRKWPPTIDENKLHNEIIKLVDQFDGIVIQLPLPKHINTQKLLDLIPAEKDIDGLRTDSIFLPATPLGVLELLAYYKIDLRNKKVAIIGESNLVGKPLKIEFIKQHINVTSFNKETIVSDLTRYDVIISAAGVPHLIKGNNIKEGVILIDVGFSVVNVNGKEVIFGDIDRQSVELKAEYLSPVPGGVGPMTVVSLFNNLITYALKKL